MKKKLRCDVGHGHPSEATERNNIVTNEEETVRLPSKAMSYHIAADAEFTELRDDADLGTAQPQHTVCVRGPTLLVVAAAKCDARIGKGFVAER